MSRRRVAGILISSAPDFIRAVLRLFGQPGLDSIEQSPIQDGGLLTHQDIALEGHFSNIEAVAK
jgi:hypothetical protein